MRKQDSTITLYALVDPRTNDIHYVGQSRAPRDRFSAHLAGVRTGKHSERLDWMRGLSEIGLKPRLELLDAVTDQSVADSRERMLIANGPDFGWPLTNMLAGGEATWQEIGASRRGKPGRTPGIEERAKIGRAHLGHVVSEETKAKLREAGKRQSPTWLGKHLSEEHKAKIAAKHIGRKDSPETIEKKRLASTGREKSLETRAKLSAANLGKTISVEQRLKIGNGNRGKKRTPEQRYAVGSANRGRKFSDSHKTGIGLAHRGRSFSEHEVVTVWCAITEGQTYATAARLAGVSEGTATRIGKNRSWTDVTAALAAQLET